MAYSVIDNRPNRPTLSNKKVIKIKYEDFCKTYQNSPLGHGVLNLVSPDDLCLFEHF